MIALAVRGRARRVRVVTRTRLLERLARAMVAAGAGAAEVSVSLVDDAEMQALNLSFLGEDRPTDVLSFGQRGSDAPDAPAGERELLGDVVISVETAARQAEARGATFDAELLHLAVHGLGHLLGYDHATPDEERRMFAWEARLREEAAGHRKPRRVAPP